ncbi:MAG: Fe-S biogenesis protein NfuA [Pseudomonadales bacterium]|nr:Fe-S biogenesis protein NfuA [Pseudomonadales bacterium]
MSDLPKSYFSITDSAQDYLRDLLSKQDSPNIGVRIFVEKPGTPHAECCMAYCPEGEAQEEDVKFEFEGFAAYLEEKSITYLEDSVTDYSGDKLGGQLTFRAPKSKVPRVSENATLEERIEYVLQSEVNPSLASHGGHVSLITLVDDDTTAVLEFGGGCQGCASVDMTLKSGVETTLLERVPELHKVVDKTDHSNKENAYY